MHGISIQGARSVVVLLVVIMGRGAQFALTSPEPCAETRGKGHEALTVGVRFPPRGFSWFLLRKRPSSKRESEVNSRGIKH